MCVCVCVRARVRERQNVWWVGSEPFFCSLRKAVSSALGAVPFSMQYYHQIHFEKNNPSTDDHCICIKIWTVEYI